MFSKSHLVRPLISVKFNAPRVNFDPDCLLYSLNIFYSSQNMIKDRAEQKVMFGPLHKMTYM